MQRVEVGDIAVPDFAGALARAPAPTCGPNIDHTGYQASPLAIFEPPDALVHQTSVQESPAVTTVLVLGMTIRAHTTRLAFDALAHAWVARYQRGDIT